jgi:hypothetical protein
VRFKGLNGILRIRQAALTHRARIGVMDMDKLFGGIVLGLLGGIAAGAFVLAPMIGGDSAPVAARTAAASKTAAESNAGDAGKSGRDTELAAEKDRLAAEVESLQRRLHDAELDASMRLKKLGDENAMLAGQRDAALGAAPVREPELAQEEVARRKTRAADLSKVISDKIAAAMASKEKLDPKDKEAILAALTEIRVLGRAAAPEYLAILAQVQKVGNPWGGWGRGGPNGGQPDPNENMLGLSGREYTDLLTPDLRNFVLETGGENVPGTVLQSVLNGLPRDTSKTREEKANLLKSVLEKATDKDVQKAAIESLQWVDPVAAAPIMLDMARNGGLDSDVRVSAVEALPDKIDADTANALQVLKNDADPKVAEAAKIAEMKSNPPVSGYLVTTVTAQGQAKTAGMRAGDIITSYNNQAITNGNLWQLQNSIADNATGPVVVYRNGLKLTYYIKKGRLGVDGEYVAKK